MKGVEWGVDQMDWFSDKSMTVRSASETTLRLEDEFISLAFSGALQPSKVIPYYYRASWPDEVGFTAEDVTITTLVTSNRFLVLEKLVQQYQGKPPPSTR